MHFCFHFMERPWAKSGSALHQPPSPLSPAPKRTSAPKLSPSRGWGGDKKVSKSSPLVPGPARRGRAARALGALGPTRLRSPDVPSPRSRKSMCLSTTVSLLRPASPAVSAGMRKSEQGWRGAGRVGGGTRAPRPQRGPLDRAGLPWWRVRARPPCACGLLSRAARPARWRGKGQRLAGPEQVRPRGGSGPGGRARGLAGPGQSAPRHVRSTGGGKRRARGGRAAAAPPSRPRRLRPGLRGAPGAGPARGAGRGRRRREARPTGRAGEAVSASPGRSGGETSSSCPGSLVHFSLFLSRSLSHFLAGNSH